MVDKRGLLADEAGLSGGGAAAGGYHTIPQPGAPAQGLPQQQAAGAEPRKGCRDPAFLAAFLVQVVGIVYLAINYGATAIREKPPGAADDPAYQPHEGHPLILLATLLAAIAGVLSGAWMTYMIQRASDIIKLTLWASIGMSLFSAVLGLVSGQFALVAFGLLFAGINFCYMRSVRRFIPFAAAQLRAATVAVKDFFSVMWVAYGLILASFLWCVIWSLAIYGVISYEQRQQNDAAASSDPNDGGGSGGGAAGLYYFLLLVSFVWTLQVVGGVLNCTVAGVVGSWWFIPAASGHKSVVSGSFGRAATTSLGSICFGALIVAVLEAMKAMVEKARESEDNAVKCLVDCLVSCLDSMAQYLNRWAFTYIGIYGYSFTEAGSKVYNLFTRRGLTTLLNDNLIGRVLCLGSLMVGLVCCGIGVILAWLLQSSYLKDFEDAPALLGGAGFLVGFFITNVMMNVVAAASAAVLVCFLEDPNALAVTHPDYHSYLLAAWALRFPDINW